jgi:hypothetical protein
VAFHLPTGIRGVERVHSWRLFFRTLFRRLRQFPLAITFSNYGSYFRRAAGLHIE